MSVGAGWWDNITYQSIEEKTAKPVKTFSERAGASRAQLDDRLGLEPVAGREDLIHITSMGELEVWVCVSGNPTAKASRWERTE